MRTYFIKYTSTFLLLLASLQLLAQSADDAISAQHFFENGNYNSAIPLLEKLYQHNPGNIIYYNNLLTSYVKIKRLDSAESLINSTYTKYPYRTSCLVDQGYIEKKKGNRKKSEEYYNEAINKVTERPNSAHSISNQFQKYLETEWALKAYITAENYNSTLNFAIQKANLYGELGNVDSMLSNYFVLIEKQPERKNAVKRYLQNFIKQNPSPEINEKVKNTILLKIQETNEPAFSELLLWYFTEKKKYDSAFVQAKSLYKRNYSDLKIIQFLGEDALKVGQKGTAEKCFKYVRTEDQSGENYFKATKSLLEMQEDKAKNKMSHDEIITEYQEAIKKEPLNFEHFSLILSYAKFIAFVTNNSDKALEILEKETTPYKQYDNIIASKYILEGDIYMIKQEFTKSFLAYQKAETWTKDQYVADEAKFKGVKVAFYKGDFKWALGQAKVLKKSVSKWYANDSAELLITLQNSYSSDSSDVPLKLYAKADLLKMQGQNDSSYAYYNQIIQSFPNHYLVPTSLYAQSDILEKSMAYNRSIETLKTLYSKFPDNNLAPFALLRLSEVYLHKLKNEEEAKEWLRELLLKFPDSTLAENARELYDEIEN